MILSFMISIAKTPKHLWTLGELMAKQYQQHEQTAKNWDTTSESPCLNN